MGSLVFTAGKPVVCFALAALVWGWTWKAGGTNYPPQVLLQLPPGFSTIANNYYHFPDDTAGVVLPYVLDGTVIYKFDQVNQTYVDSTFVFGIGWIPETTLHPGEGAWLYSPGPQTRVLEGEAHPPSPLPRPPPGLYFVGGRAPAPATFEDLMGFPPSEGDRVYYYPRGLMNLPAPGSQGAWGTNTFSGGQWDVVPMVGPGSATFVELAAPNSQPPAIVQQPSDLRVNLGSTASFGVSATGPSLRYEWYFNDLRIPGQSSSFLQIPVVGTNHAGLYHVIVRNNAGSAVSSNAQLSVNLPPQFLPISNVVVHAGAAVYMELAAQDPDTSAHRLSYALLSGPAGAAIDPVTGVFFWNTSTDYGGLTQTVAVAVLDDGVPPLQDALAFEIAVLPEFALLSITLADRAATLIWRSIPGFIYRVVYKANLSDPVWTPLPGDVTATTYSSSKRDDARPENVPRFYAVVTIGNGSGTTIASECILDSRVLPGPGIGAWVVGPPNGVTTRPENPPIPLIVTGSDADQVVQQCVCYMGELSCFSGKAINVADSVQYRWTIIGDGSLVSGDGPANLYVPPDLEVGQKKSASVVVYVEDERGNDGPAQVTYEITTERFGLCLYRQTIASSAPGPGGPPGTSTPLPCDCLPAPETWQTVPAALFADAPAQFDVCAGERALLPAIGSDDDLLRLRCIAQSCGFDQRLLLMIDALEFTWTAGRGSFPDYGVTATSNSRRTGAIYLAPESPGLDTITVVVRDTGTQAPDNPITLNIPVVVHKLTVEVGSEIAGPAFTSVGAAACNTCVLLNDDDDNGNSIPDKNESPVPGENNLVPLSITKLPATGKVSIEIKNRSRGRVALWEDKEKKKAAAASYSAASVPQLWIEGTEYSDKLADVQIIITGDPACQEKREFTVVRADLDVDTNRDGVWDDKDDADEDKMPEYKKPPGGALVLANVDDDDPDNKVDCEDDVITSPKDAADLTKLIVRQTKIPAGWDLYLDLVEGDTNIHVFEKLDVGTASILGPFTTNGSNFSRLSYQVPNKVQNGDLTLYVEGINPGESARLTLSFYEGTNKLACDDSVRLLVTPIIFLPNTNLVQRAFYSFWGGHNAMFHTNFVARAAEVIIPASNVVQVMGQEGTFVQDVFEIGYQQTEANHAGNKVVMPVVVDVPFRIIAMNDYPKNELLKPDFGFIQLQPEVDPTGGADYAGNLETVPSLNPALPWGRLVIGENMTSDLRAFLLKQKVQVENNTLFELPFTDTHLRHVDELMNVVPSTTGNKFKVVVGDIGQAVALLRLNNDPEFNGLRQQYTTNQAAVTATSNLLNTVTNLFVTKAGLLMSDIVRIPVLYPAGEFFGFGLPNAVNLQVVRSPTGQRIFVPAPMDRDHSNKLFDAMQTRIHNNLVSAGVPVADIIFINTTELSARGGEAHCATNAERKP